MNNYLGAFIVKIFQTIKHMFGFLFWENLTRQTSFSGDAVSTSDEENSLGKFTPTI